MEQIKTHEELKKNFFLTKEKLFTDGISCDDEELDKMSAVVTSFRMTGKTELEREKIEEISELVLALVYSE